MSVFETKQRYGKLKTPSIVKFVVKTGGVFQPPETSSSFKLWRGGNFHQNLF